MVCVSVKYVKFVARLLVFSFVFSVISPAFACTTMIITPGATADGSMYVAHSDDNDLADNSIVYVPAADWPKGSVRKVYPSAVAVGELPQYNAFLIPRLVAPSRAKGYDYRNKPLTIAVGEIPQARHTYAYLDGSYGIVNEHGLMFGECTNGAKVENEPLPGKRIFYSSELSRVALERCKTAREAIALIGELIEKYGYYGTGETLPVADAKEGWVIEMAPSPEGDGGLWVAQRVPDGEIFIAANEFRIRDLDPNSPDQIIGKKTIETIEKAGWRAPADKSRKIDWLASVSLGEYNHPYYSLRRVWRGLSLAAPSLGLSPWVKNGLTRDYPFTVKPDKKFERADIERIYRDHYEGTEFDMTKGFAAGPFGNPARYLGPNDGHGDVGTPDNNMAGAWERPISMFYEGYSFINQVKPGVGEPLNVVSWIALNVAAESVYIPLAVAPLPSAYHLGDAHEFSWDSAWSVYNLVGEFANIKYDHMIKDISFRARVIEERSDELLASLRGRLSDADVKTKRDSFASALRKNADDARQDWIKLFTELVIRYRQGFVNDGKNFNKAAYPADWLAETNYSTGPTKYEKRGK